MVSLDAVAPRATLGWSAEQREIIFLRVAVLATVVLNDLEYILQAHDRHRFDVARLAQPGCQQRARKVLLKRRHLSQGQSLAFLGNEVPVHALVGVEVKYGFAALIVI